MAIKKQFGFFDEACTIFITGSTLVTWISFNGPCTGIEHDLEVECSGERNTLAHNALPQDGSSLKRCSCKESLSI